MSLYGSGGDREKFDFLLQLAYEQIAALEADDLFAFDRILASKDTVIASFVDARTLVASDASLGTVIQQIQDADKTAQRLLYRKTGRLMRQLTEIQQQKKARSAYQSPATSSAHMGTGEAPRFMDQRS